MSRSRLLVDVLHSIGFSVSYLEVLKFEKCVVVFSVKFDGFANDSALGLENRFWQFIASNLDHNEDTTTGDNNIYLMGIISSETPKSEFTMFQPITREDIFQQNYWKLLSLMITTKCAVNQLNANSIITEENT